MAAEKRQIEASQTVSERIKRLRLMQGNPILVLVGQTEDMRRDYYPDLELRMVAGKEGVEICGVFGSRIVTPTRAWATNDLEATVEAAARGTTALKR